MIVQKFIKFGIVGATGFVIDFSLTYALIQLLACPEYVSNALGFTVAAGSNYVLNRVWTFHSRNPNVRGEFLRFFIVSLLGLGINNLILVGYIEFLGCPLSIYGWVLPAFWVAKILATGVVMVWNFAVNNRFTFSGAVGGR